MNKTLDMSKNEASKCDSSTQKEQIKAHTQRSISPLVVDVKGRQSNGAFEEFSKTNDPTPGLRK